MAAVEFKLNFLRAPHNNIITKKYHILTLLLGFKMFFNFFESFHRNPSGLSLDDHSTTANGKFFDHFCDSIKNCKNISNQNHVCKLFVALDRGPCLKAASGCCLIERTASCRRRRRRSSSRSSSSRSTRSSRSSTVGRQPCTCCRKQFAIRKLGSASCDGSGRRARHCVTFLRLAHDVET